NLNGKMMIKHIDIGMIADGIDQAQLYFCTGAIFVMQNSKFRMTSLSVKIEVPLFILIKIDSPVNELSNLGRCLFHHFLHYLHITQSPTRIERVGNMFFKIIPWICNRGYS